MFEVSFEIWDIYLAEMQEKEESGSTLIEMRKYSAVILNSPEQFLFAFSIRYY